jgi:hypothetical protein
MRKQRNEATTILNVKERSRRGKTKKKGVKVTEGERRGKKKSKEKGKKINFMI